MLANTHIIARIAVDRCFAGGIIDKLREYFPDYNKYERLAPDGNEDVIHVLEFTIDEKKASTFFEHYHRLGKHGGELVFYRPLKIPEAVAA
ncbi:hypothetical protein K2Q00_03150 [Patescibacteria group bacterium]|nr:hypothetical protein [Patescibacteria group bacterium]